MSRFTIGILFFCICFGICSLAVGEERLLVTLEEQEEISQRVIDLMTANQSSIRTWQGKAIITSRMFEDGGENTEPSDEMKYEVDFAFDVVNGHEAWDSRFSLGNRAHARENSFVRDGVHHYLTTGHSNDGGLRQLHIFPEPQLLVIQFNPFEASIPPNHSPGTIIFRLSMTILEWHIANRRAQGISEEENEEFRQNVLANGFTNYRFRLDGDVITREMVLSGRLREIFVVNLAQGGNIVMYRSFTGSMFRPEPDIAFAWDATYQKVNNVWIPKTTRATEVFDCGGSRIVEIEWVDQKINQKIPEERFTMRGIGAFQGIEVIDYRTGEVFRATGDEFPPEFELPVRLFTRFQWIVMSLGVLLVLIGGGSLIYKKLKKLKANG